MEPVKLYEMFIKEKALENEMKSFILKKLDRAVFVRKVFVEKLEKYNKSKDPSLPSGQLFYLDFRYDEKHLQEDYFIPVR